jgi:hypothetical protein
MPREANWTPKYSFGIPHGWEIPDISPHSPAETVAKKRQTRYGGQRVNYVYRNVGERTGYSEQREGTGWIYAPVTSHISRFLFTDARLNPEMAEYGPQGGASQLQVIFKGANYEGEDDEYIYYFHDPYAGLEIANAMATAAHPYADVLLPQVIRAGVPYFRLASTR